VPSGLTLRPTQLPVQWLPGHSPVVKRPGRGSDHSLLAPGCKWGGTTPPPPIFACPPVSWGDLYIYLRFIFFLGISSSASCPCNCWNISDAVSERLLSYERKLKSILNIQIRREFYYPCLLTSYLLQFYITSLCYIDSYSLRNSGNLLYKHLSVLARENTDFYF